MNGIEDTDTVAYFDEHVPEYSVGRLERPAAFISANGGATASIVDIGCGAGNTLAYLRDATGASALCGVDVSANLLERTREAVPGCETHLGSIIDPALVDQIGRERFDFAVIAAVLHHLIGRTRRESHERARLAVLHAPRAAQAGRASDRGRRGVLAAAGRGRRLLRQESGYAPYVQAGRHTRRVE